MSKNDIDDKNDINENQDNIDTQDLPANEEKLSNDKKSKDKNSSKDDEESLDELIEKMEKLVKEVSDEYGVEPDKVKVMAVPTPKFTFLSILITSLVILVFDFILMVALTKLFAWASYPKVANLITFAGMFALMEVILKLASLPLFKMKHKNIIVLSIIKVIPFIITCIICIIWPTFVERESFYLYVLVCLLIYAIRKFYTTYFLEKQMNKLMKQHSKRMLKKIEKETEKENKN